MGELEKRLEHWRVDPHDREDTADGTSVEENRTVNVLDLWQTLLLQSGMGIPDIALQCEILAQFGLAHVEFRFFGCRLLDEIQNSNFQSSVWNRGAHATSLTVLLGSLMDPVEDRLCELED